MVIAFLHHVEHDRGNGPATRNLRLASIKSFMRYVELRHPGALEQIAQINAIPGKRHDQKLDTSTNVLIEDGRFDQRRD